MFLSSVIHTVISLFAVMNPLGVVPIFLTLTNGYSVQEQRSTARKSTLIAFVILLVFLVLGHFILNLFGITIDAFRVAGGIIIFGIAYNLLRAKSSDMQAPNDKEQQHEITEKEDISVTPLATPIIAGPGTIATIMALSAGEATVMNSVAVFVAFVLVLIATYFIFYYSSWINKALGEKGLNIITRLMGLILAIVAVQMAVNGLGRLFPGLLHP